MKSREGRRRSWGEGWLIAAALAVVLALFLVVFMAERPRKQVLSPVHMVSDAVLRVEMVNLNTADAEEIATLPGVGEVLAGRIVEYRQEFGGFKAIEDLLNVYGIGEGKLEAMRGKVYIE